jgi:DNA-binding LacI/PurR family transcriptional regulator/biotin operon repressor
MSQVTVDHNSTKHLSLALRQTLSQSPSQVGMRLQSEEKLASELGIGRRQIRDAINQLVDDGVLIRQRGSGTFVRQLPKPPAQTLEIPDRNLGASILFATDGHRSVNALRERHNGAIANKQVLHFGLWGDMHCSTETNQVTIQGIVEATQAAGHRLSLHSVISSPDKGMAAQAIADELLRHPCDGYLVTGVWSALFEEAAVIAGISPDCPRVYVGGGRSSEVFEPAICPDLSQIMYRALDQFKQQGFKRLAVMLHGNIANPTMDKLHEAVRQYALISGCTCQVVCPPPTFAGGMKAVRELFAHSDPSTHPQGIFVFDNRLLEGVAESLQMLDLTAGQDVGVIVLAHRGIALTDHFDWSRLEIDIIQMGRLAVQILLQQLSEPDQHPCSLMLHPRWIASQTHTCNAHGVHS